MNKALLDTDILIEISKAVNPNVIRRAKEYKSVHTHYTISAITVMEMIMGFWKKRLNDDLELFRRKQSKLEVLNFKSKEADLAGRIFADLENAGKVIGECDVMIASIAISNGLILVTGNTKHYQRIVDLGYDLELNNWRD